MIFCTVLVNLISQTVIDITEKLEREKKGRRRGIRYQIGGESCPSQDNWNLRQNPITGFKGSIKLLEFSTKKL
jgi:hypothetical protein